MYVILLGDFLQGTILDGLQLCLSPLSHPKVRRTVLTYTTKPGFSVLGPGTVETRTVTIIPRQEHMDQTS